MLGFGSTPRLLQATFAYATLAASPCAAGSFTYTDLVPSAYFSAATGINDVGQVVGYVMKKGNDAAYGFSWQSDTVTYASKGYFGGVITDRGKAICGGCGPTTAQDKNRLYIYDINTGRITHLAIGQNFFSGKVPLTYDLNVRGVAAVGDGFKSYVVTKAGLTPLVPPGVDIGLINASGINKSGTVVGTFNDRSEASNYIFVYANGSYTVIPSQGYTDEAQPYYVFVTDKGVIGGGPTLPFTYANGAFTTYMPPEGLAGGAVVGIGPAGEVVGSYYHVKDYSEYGFVSLHGHFHTIKFPGSDSTHIAAVNAAGTIVGNYFYHHERHAFLATCPATEAPCTQ